MLVGNSDLSYEEVAAQCHCPVGTVKSRVSRARLDLKRLLEDEDMAQPRRNVPPIADANLTEALSAAGIRRGRRKRSESRLIN